MTPWDNPADAPTRGATRRAELVLVGGRIRTPSHPSGFTQAAAIADGVILALGRDDEIREFIGPFTRVVDRERFCPLTIASGQVVHGDE